VTEGKFTSLSYPYSKDLDYIVKLCLQVQPDKRPSCAELLQKSQLLKNRPKELQLTTDESKPGLMGTIKVPRNLGMITERLPASQYEPKEEKRLSRNASLPVIEERTSPINQQ